MKNEANILQKNMLRQIIQRWSGRSMSLELQTISLFTALACLTFVFVLFLKALESPPKRHISNIQTLDEAIKFNAIPPKLESK